MADSTECLNCSALLEANALYCANCGQKVQPLKSTLRELLAEAWDAAFGIDSKFLRTIWYLVLAPGFLTAEYLSGKRVHYLRPVTLFLISAAVLFVGMEWIGALRKETPREIANGKYRSYAILPGFNVTFTGEQLSELDEATDEDILKVIQEIDAELTPTQELIGFNAMRIIRDDGIQNFRQGIYEIASQTVAILIPLMACLVKLFHLRRGLYFVDAAIYCFHLHALFFIAFLFLTLLPDAGPREWSLLALVPYLFWYTAKSLCVSFGNGFWVAWLKAMGLLLSHGFVVFVLTAILILIGIYRY